MATRVEDVLLDAVRLASHTNVRLRGLPLPNFLLQGFIVEAVATTADQLRRKNPRSGYRVPDRDILRQVVLRHLPLQPQLSQSPWPENLASELTPLISRRR